MPHKHKHTNIVCADCCPCAPGSAPCAYCCPHAYSLTLCNTAEQCKARKV